MMQSIEVINRDTVHRICSGQVVVSLAIAVKELVENSLDAGATIIDIHLKEYGSELIEVCDNGSGVVREHFQALTLKHYTSKIKQFDDLTTLSTLGFRGEALSSLCALSDLTVTTKHTTAEHATKITYDRSGKITGESLSAREPGTTVSLENLFSTLPVRRKEFTKNLKREFNKMCQLLYAYCLVSKGVKFSCTNTTNKGSRNSVVATEGSSTVRDNIVNVFGAKQIATLIEVEIAQPEPQVLADFGVKLVEGEALPFTFELFVSSVTHGSGRSSNDRQFFYINSRPCEPTKIAKLVNEVYKQYNSSQYPFVYLNVTSKSCLVDVNVTPDKRQVFLEKEKVLLATLKSSLIEAFKMFPSTFKMQNVDLTQNTTIKDYFGAEQSSVRGLKRGFSESDVKKGGILEKFKKRSKTENDKIKARNSLLSKVSESESNDKIKAKCNLLDKSNENLDSFIEIASRIVENESDIILDAYNDEIKEEICEVEEIKIVCPSNGYIDKTNVANDELLIAESSENCSPSVEIKEIVVRTTREESGDEADIIENSQPIESHDHINKPKYFEERVMHNEVELTLLDSSIRNPSDYKSVTLSTSMDDIKLLMKKKNQAIREDADIKVRFRAQINPESNKSAEEELGKQIAKDDFKTMTVIGQFNLGFIITKLQNDLFIVDQHAADEKYNFEDLQANTVMDSQILVNPKPLQLTAGNESLLIENEEIFKKNGFSFKIDETAPCTKKISLTAVPLSRNIIFGKDDIDEMLFILQHANHMMCRPTRLRAMFASRACRKSVMVGNALSKSDMRRLVDHMGEIEQPWNCPHGRPTMRHLVNLDLIEKNE